MEKKTPLYQTHVDMGGKIVEFGGFLMPVQYPTPPLPQVFHNENPSQRRRPISRRYPPQISTSALPLCLPKKRPLDRCPNGSESAPC